MAFFPPSPSFSASPPPQPLLEVTLSPPVASHRQPCATMHSLAKQVSTMGKAIHSFLAKLQSIMGKVTLFSSQIDGDVSFTVDFGTNFLPKLKANRSQTGCQRIVKHSEIRQYLRKHTRDKILKFRVLLNNNPTDMLLQIGILLHYAECNFKIEENEEKLKVLNVYGLPNNDRNCFCSAGRREYSSEELIKSVPLKSPETKKASSGASATGNCSCST